MKFVTREHVGTDQFNHPIYEDEFHVIPIAGVIAGILVGIILFYVGCAGGLKAYNRYQARQDAQNAVTITHTHIAQQQQQVAVAAQEAQAKIAEARGIHKSQEIINATLTPLYVQHEAIQAQLSMANSPNHTEIYIPSGNNGVPLVQPLGNNK